jgi:hypothetical protein|eukprot:CAMPEP_0117039226 /NCGR_PEP_ID=MMETSP0472-20121206/27552_1 /TAXON_ID=693140 ORGANISM="Tiarina fusus, Strain LIS" /NCGR_SAMPLE_ID=MMETSP0472 /ASSEMBLY_ACC=CAM_ASM_000603 /LENGTH=120 /DNA_ID=CAMNT_0004749675 /DNA_START=30 /DNA_END=392 /DNA_ORIENTATION=-
MKFSAIVLLVVFCLLAVHAQAVPTDSKLKPKPKPKPKPKKHVPTTIAPSYVPASDNKFVADSNIVDQTNLVRTVESTGLVAVLGGVAVACVVAIVAILRKPEIQHEPLPDGSERAVDQML